MCAVAIDIQVVHSVLIEFLIVVDVCEFIVGFLIGDGVVGSDGDECGC